MTRNRQIKIGALLLASIWAGCAAQNEPVAHPTPISPPETASIRGIIVNAQDRPVNAALVVAAHESDATIVYSGGRMLAAVERRADELPGSGRLPGRTSAMMTTGPDGTFEFREMALGRYTLATVEPNSGIAIQSGLESTDGRPPARLRMTDLTTLTVLLDHFELDRQREYLNLEAPSPWPNVELSLRMEPIDGVGKFAVGPIPQTREWTLIVWALSKTRNFTSPLLSEPVELIPGEDNRLDLDMGNGAVLAGRLVDRAGEPLEGAAVMARSPDNPRRARGAFSAADGSYEIKGLRNGDYHVEALRHGWLEHIGCGSGPVDVRVSRRIHVPVARPDDALLRLETRILTPEIGDLAPDFRAKTIDGKEIRLSTYRGAVVLLDFWATWCGACLADMKHIARLHQEMGENGRFSVISISLDKDPRAVERFLARQKLPWSQLVLGPPDQNPIAALYNVMSTPTTLLIDPQGRIAGKHIPGDQLRQEVLKLLKSGD